MMTIIKYPLTTTDCRGRSKESIWFPTANNPLSNTPHMMLSRTSAHVIEWWMVVEIRNKGRQDHSQLSFHPWPTDPVPYWPPWHYLSTVEHRCWTETNCNGSSDIPNSQTIDTGTNKCNTLQRACGSVIQRPCQSYQVLVKSDPVPTGDTVYVK